VFGLLKPSWQFCQHNHPRRFKMNMPKALSTWFMVLFFLFAGLAAFGVFAAPGWLTGIFALGAAITLFMGK